MAPSDDADPTTAQTSEDRPWFARPMDEVVHALDVDPEGGLSSEEAADRLERHGPNELAHEEGPGIWEIVLDQLREPLVLVLIVAAAISLAAWLAQADPAHPLPYDTLVIAAIVVLNTLLGFVQEYRAERAVESLREMTSPRARVRRDGSRQEVDAEEVVPGDVLLLEPGDRIPADARLVEVASLGTEEAALTGESETVAKRTDPVEDSDTPVADRANMVFMGTSVARGRGVAVVVETGMETVMGDIAGMLQTTTDEETPLQEQLARVGRQLGVAVVVISLVVAAAGLVRADAITGGVLLSVFLFAVALAVAAVPEGLPAIVTASLALGVRRLARQNAIVRHLTAVETLGSADVIASDKTGTLTRNQMTVRRILMADGRRIAVTGEGFDPEGEFREVEGAEDGDGAGEEPVDPAEDDRLRRLLRLAVLDNDALLEEGKDGWSVDGDPTEGALVVAARKAGIDEAALRDEHPRAAEIPFSAERKRMTTVHTLDDERVAVVKGAAEVVLDRCDRIRGREGVEPLAEERRDELLEANERLAGDALRTLAVASRTLPNDVDAEDADAVERELVFEGVVGMLDPPREESARSVEAARAAGVRTVMLTGDHVLTARAIARQVGITDAEDAPVLSGRDVQSMDDEELRERVREVDVFGRVGPEDKLRILRALESHGHTVAMTGDGVNDAPAVKEADIGVAMGRTGTDVTREASDVVLTDDNYATIVRAISEGRRIFDNLRSFIRYLLSANAGEVLMLFAAVVLAGALGLGVEGGELFLPLLPTQILWINLVTDGAPALALGMSPAEPGHMDRPPRPPEEPVIDRPMWVRIGLVGSVIMVGCLAVLDAYLPGGFLTAMVDPGREDPAAYARTAVFTTLLMFEMFDVFNSVSGRSSVFRSRIRDNPWLLGAVALSLALHAAVLYWAPLQAAFSTVPLGIGDWAVATAVASSVVIAVELLKRTPLVRRA